MQHQRLERAPCALTVQSAVPSSIFDRSPRPVPSALHCSFISTLSSSCIPFHLVIVASASSLLFIQRRFFALLYFLLDILVDLHSKKCLPYLVQNPYRSTTCTSVDSTILPTFNVLSPSLALQVYGRQQIEQEPRVQRPNT